MADRPSGQRDLESVSTTDHDSAVVTVAESLGIPGSLLEEAIAEARAVGRHRARAVPAQRIDELISELADSPGEPGTV